MSPSHRSSSRRELGLIACALLLPIPLLAVSGLSVPLSSAVERGIASLVPSATGADDDALSRSASAKGVPPNGELGLARVRASQGTDAALPGGSRVGSDDPGRPDGAAGGTGNGGDPTGSDGAPPTGGNTPPDSPGTEGQAPAAEDSSAGSGSNAAPGVQVTGVGQGTSAGVYAGGEGVTVDTGSSDGSGAPNASVEITYPDGSKTEVDTNTPPLPALPTP